jgi:hypothetical protein
MGMVAALFFWGKRLQLGINALAPGKKFLPAKKI